MLTNQTIDLSNPALFESKSLFKEMAILNPNAINKTQKAMQFIHDNHIEGVIIGGIAVSHYTEDRPLTPDVDFLTNNIHQIEQTLKANGIEYHPLASTGDFGGVNAETFDIDFLDANVGMSTLNNYIINHHTTTTIGGVQMPIINKELLTIMKFVIGRNKDTDDAFKLLAKCNIATLKTHLQKLKGIIEDEIRKEIWSYTKMYA
jgi:predicted nucleotidyltransferase